MLVIVPTALIALATIIVCCLLCYRSQKRSEEQQQGRVAAQTEQHQRTLSRAFGRISERGAELSGNITHNFRVHQGVDTARAQLDHALESQLPPEHFLCVPEERSQDVKAEWSDFGRDLSAYAPKSQSRFSDMGSSRAFSSGQS